MASNLRPTDFHESPPCQGRIGKCPLSYLTRDLPEKLGPYDTSIKLIPGEGRRPLDRCEVLLVSGNPKVHALVAYACIMAWGGRNLYNYRLSLAGDNTDRVIELVEYLRKSNGTREQDFAETRKKAENIKGLGISFYTKLLFFLRAKPDAYILDQWTAKSASVLFPKTGVKLTSGGLPDPETSPETYEAFCQALEVCVGSSGWGKEWTNGEEVERTIFDRPRGRWRNELKRRLKEEPTIASGDKTPVRDASLAPLPALQNGGRRCAEDDKQGLFIIRLQDIYSAKLATGVDLPEGCGERNSGNRLHIRFSNGVTFQFIINASEVRAQIYFSATETYRALCKKFDAQVVMGKDDFGGDIKGNRTHAIDRYAAKRGGYASPVNEWAAICRSAVDAMQQLFKYLG